MSLAGGIMLSGCAMADADRAAAVVEKYIGAYRQGDRAAVIALTEPSRREMGFDESIARTVSSGSDILGVEVEGTWAVAGVRFELDGRPEALLLLMHESDGEWMVACPFGSGLTEVFSLFDGYPDPPPESLEYLPGRRFTSRAWRESARYPELLPGASLVVPVKGGRIEEGERLRFTVKGAHLARIRATTPGDARPHIVLHSPEGGARSSRNRITKARGERYSEGDAEALIQRGVWDGTYLVDVAAQVPTDVEVTLELLPVIQPAGE